MAISLQYLGPAVGLFPVVTAMAISLQYLGPAVGQEPIKFILPEFVSYLE